MEIHKKYDANVYIPIEVVFRTQEEYDIFKGMVKILHNNKNMALTTKAQKMVDKWYKYCYAYTGQRDEGGYAIRTNFEKNPKQYNMGDL